MTLGKPTRIYFVQIEAFNLDNSVSFSIKKKVNLCKVIYAKYFVSSSSASYCQATNLSIGFCAT